ncbi:MAG: ABC transporter permease, partial [Gemmatimonadetes bacterium]|nr:ABC transporter permease [Gemmatimonadota bacterium]
LSTLRSDLAYAVRMIVKTPVVTLIAIVSLAVGIAANTSIFSLLHSWMLRPLPYANADRMVLIYEDSRNDPDDADPVATANFFDWRERATSFDTWIASNFRRGSLTGVDQPQRLVISNVTPNYFSALGQEPMLGRTFLPDEGRPSSSPVAVLGETVWRTQFGGDTALVGSTIMLNGEAHTVVGVVEETFDFIIGGVQLWIAATFEDARDDRQTRGLTVTAWYRGDVTLEQARSEMATIASRLEEEYPATNENWGVTVRPIREQFPQTTDRGLITILMAVVLMALLIACANVASLLLAKTEARHKELAVRSDLFAGKGRIVQQLLTESVLLALIAGTIGMVASIWGVRALAAVIPAILPRVFLPTFDGGVVAFGVVLSVASGLTFGVAPALQAFSGDLRAALTETTRGGTATKFKKRLRGAFVMVEFAMALTILIAAAVLTDVFTSTLDIDPGYDAENLLTMEITLPQHKYEDGPAMARFFDDIERELQELAGARGLAFMNELPRSFGLPRTSFTIDGQPVERNEEPRARWLTLNAAYFATLGIPLRDGRTFTDADRADAPPVVMVNQQFADRFFEDSDPIGRRITVRGESREIVGVASNIAQTRLAGLEPIQPAVYFPLPQLPSRTMLVAIRTQGDPYEVAAPAQRAVWSVDVDQPIAAVQTLEEFIETQMAAIDLLGKIMFLIGFVALALAAIGIYGVMAYSVTQQTGEIGLRMALGAKPRQVLMQITRQGALLAGAGIVIGTPLAIVVSRMIAGLPVDIPGASTQLNSSAVMPILWVSVILTSVGLIACLLPARRATQIDPVVALREE